MAKGTKFWVQGHGVRGRGRQPDTVTGGLAPCLPAPPCPPALGACSCPFLPIPLPYCSYTGHPGSSFPSIILLAQEDHPLPPHSTCVLDTARSAHPSACPIHTSAQKLCETVQQTLGSRRCLRPLTFPSPELNCHPLAPVPSSYVTCHSPVTWCQRVYHPDTHVTRPCLQAAVSTLGKVLALLGQGPQALDTAGPARVPQSQPRSQEGCLLATWLLHVKRPKPKMAPGPSCDPQHRPHRWPFGWPSLALCPPWTGLPPAPAGATYCSASTHGCPPLAHARKRKE